MFMSFVKPEARTFDTSLSVVSEPVRPYAPRPRAEHAHLLEIAAARRLRAMDRRRDARLEDADYWIACAPAAVAKAAGLREAFRPLP